MKLHLHLAGFGHVYEIHFCGLLTKGGGEGDSGQIKLIFIKDCFCQTSTIRGIQDLGSKAHKHKTKTLRQIVDPRHRLRPGLDLQIC